jgi:hypothetical protein
LSKRARLHRKWIQRQLQERHGTPAGPRSTAALSQQQLGNRAVQRLLAHEAGAALIDPQVQRQAEEKEAQKPPLSVKLGEVAIEKPTVETYDVTGNNLRDVSEQLLQDGKWYEYEYEPRHKADKGVVNRVDVTVHITIHVPRWTGEGWESASIADKAEWMQLLQFLDTGNEKESAMVTELASTWLGVDIEMLPDKLKSTWKGMMQELQAQELGPLSTARRRALVLQRRLFGQPENLVKTIIEKFHSELRIEEQAYGKQMEMGQMKKISVGASVLVQ